jgi:hypothetical protein
LGIVRKQCAPPALLESIFPHAIRGAYAHCKQSEIWPTWPDLVMSGTALAMRPQYGCENFSFCLLQQSSNNHGLLLGVRWLTLYHFHLCKAVVALYSWILLYHFIW